MRFGKARRPSYTEKGREETRDGYVKLRFSHLQFTPDKGIHDGDASGDIVQFTAPLYFVEEHEGFVLIDVMRLGTLKGEGSVQYKTVDASATEDDDYYESSGEIVFRPGETQKEIKIRLRENDIFKTTLEFKIILTQPEGCQLGVYLHTCRVKIIDESAFPSDKFKHALQQGRENKTDLVETVKDFNVYTLFVEFILLLLDAASLKTTTILIIVCDQIENLYQLWTVYLSMYVVNTVLNTHKPEGSLILSTRHETLYLICAGYLIPLVILQSWAYAKEKLDLEAAVIDFTRVNLFRKYLNYSLESRSAVDVGAMSLALDADAEKLARGYAGLCQLFTVAGKVSVAFYFTWVEAESALWIISILPVVTLLWVVYRVSVLLRLDGAARAKVSMLSFLNDVCANYDLVDNYGIRSFAVEIFETRAHSVSSLSRALRQFELNSIFFIKWTTPIIFCVYMLMEGPKVIEGETSLGEYLAVVRIIYEMGQSCLVAYECLTGIMHCFKPLGRVVVLFNRPTDLPERRQANRKRRQASYTERKLALNTPSDLVVKSDLMPIKFTNVSYVLSDGSMILRDATVQVQQGNLISLIGPHRSGKNMFLKLLCMKILPTKGEVFVPTHLRVLYVSQEPAVLSLSPYHNLTLGLPKGAYPEHKRVEEILDKLGMVETLAYLRKNFDQDPIHLAEWDFLDSHEQTWKTLISATEYRLFHLARALITNSEVTVLEKPMTHFDDNYEKRLFDAFRCHVDNRGISMPDLGTKSYLRRPRTIFFSTMERRHAKFSDVILNFARADDESQPQISAKDPALWSPFTPNREQKQATRLFPGSSLAVLSSLEQA